MLLVPGIIVTIRLDKHDNFLSMITTHAAQPWVIRPTQTIKIHLTDYLQYT